MVGLRPHSALLSPAVRLFSGEESDYLAYTRWVNLVDRKGLFRVNDQLYTFFAEVEMIVSRHLARMLSFAAVGHENVNAATSDCG